MSLSYRVNDRCSERDSYKWTVKKSLPLTLEEVYATDWEFLCLAHGAQRAQPFQAEVKRVFLGKHGNIGKKQAVVSEHKYETACAN